MAMVGGWRRAALSLRRQRKDGLERLRGEVGVISFIWRQWWPLAGSWNGGGSASLSLSSLCQGLSSLSLSLQLRIRTDRSDSKPSSPQSHQKNPFLPPNLDLLVKMERPQILVLTLIFMFTVAHSMRFELQSGHTKCISEDIKSNAMTVGKYSIINPNEGYPIPDNQKITVRVTSPYGNNYHFGDNVDSGNFAFSAAEAGDYSACFWAADSKPPSTVTIDFEWKTGVAAKDWSKVAKKGQVEVMELELKKLYDTVSSIHDEMFFLREREEEMQQLNRATNSKMATFSFLSIVICLAVAGLQFWHLKTFFERKKLL